MLARDATRQACRFWASSSQAIGRYSRRAAILSTTRIRFDVHRRRIRRRFIRSLGQIRRACGTASQQHGSRVGPVSCPGTRRQHAIVQQDHRRLRPISPVTFDLLHDLIQRTALNEESVDPHPGGRTIHAAVAMDEDRPGRWVLGQRQGLVQEGIRGVRRGIGGARTRNEFHARGQISTRLPARDCVAPSPRGRG